jgi:peptidyl-prolyl cis-trans isomerase D
MLQEMRKFTKSWVANIFLGLLTLSFVSWGVGDILSGRSDTAVAKVGGKAIDQREFQRDYSNALRSEGDRRGKALSSEEARRIGLPNAILEQGISRLALDNVVDKLGLTASDAMVTATIHRYPVFSGLTGQFDRQTFQRTIERIGYTEQGFIELIRSDTMRTQLVRAVEGGFAMPPGYARAMFAYFTEMRAADYIVIEGKALGAIPAPPDAVLQAFVKAHPDKFSTPEYRDVTYAWIAPDDVAAQVKVSDEQIKTAYDEHKDEFVKPEKRDLELLPFAKEADAKAAYEKGAKGGNFAQITNEKSEKPTPLAAMSAEDLGDPAISKAVFALSKGGVTQPLKTATGGWALYRVVNITPGSIKTLEQAKDEIRSKIVQELAQSKLTDISNAYTDASSAGASLTDAAKKVGMHTGHVTAMDASGLAPDGTKTAAPDDPDFRALVFRAEAGEEGDPQIAKSGVGFVVSVNGSTPPKLKPLDQVRAPALAAWTDKQRAILLKKKAQELTAQANREGSLDGAARAIGATTQQSQALNHNTQNDVFSQTLVANLFQAKPGQSVFGPKGNSGDYVVARVTGILHPPLPEKSPGYLTAVREMSGGVAGGITESFIAEQREEQGVTTNQKLLNGVLGSEGS